MPNYTVTVSRKVIGVRDFIVVGAKNDREARKTAATQASNFEFSSDNPHYEISALVELKPNQVASGHLPVLVPDPST